MKELLAVRYGYMLLCGQGLIMGYIQSVFNKLNLNKITAKVKIVWGLTLILIEVFACSLPNTVSQRGSHDLSRVYKPFNSALREALCSTLLHNLSRKTMS